MENEFDFFNNLNFGTDFTKQGLGGYGTYTDQYTTPVDTGDPNPVLIESPTGIETIPAPITPFINQGNDGNAGIPTLKTSTYNETLEDELTDEDKKSLEIAKKDTNVNNLINMGLVDKAKDYVKNNYGYMIMNVIFPGSGYVAKTFVEKKKEKELAAAAAKKEEEQKIADAAEKVRLEKLAKQNINFDPSGPTQRSIRESRPDKSGSGQIGGFTNPGKGSYGPHMAKGGIITL